jgi:hypothetical protein
MGMVSLVIGIILKNIGSKGMAGSGLILDPEKARENFIILFAKLTNPYIILQNYDIILK